MSAETIELPAALFGVLYADHTGIWQVCVLSDRLKFQPYNL